MGKASRKKQDRKMSESSKGKAAIRVAALSGVCESIKSDDLEEMLEWLAIFESYSGEDIFDINISSTSPNGIHQQINLITAAAATNSETCAIELLTLAAKRGHDSASDFITFAMYAMEGLSTAHPGYRTLVNVVEAFTAPNEISEAKSLLEQANDGNRLPAMSGLMRSVALRYLSEHEKAELDAVVCPPSEANRRSLRM